MDANRKTAYYALMDVESKKAYSNIALNHQIICGRPSSPSFVRELVYGVLEHKMLLDYIINHFVKTGTAKMKIKLSRLFMWTKSPLLSLQKSKFLQKN